jgi:hypothetical protein
MRGAHQIMKSYLPGKTPYDKTRIERQINATDHQIDHLVYELYGLTDKEIDIVDGKGTC